MFANSISLSRDKEINFVFFSREVDIWAIGCLYSEMRSGDPLFPGESDIDQLFQITQLIGKQFKNLAKFIKMCD